MCVQLSDINLICCLLFIFVNNYQLQINVQNELTGTVAWYELTGTVAWNGRGRAGQQKPGGFSQGWLRINKQKQDKNT